MAKSAWDYTLDFIKVATDIDYYNDELGKCKNSSDRIILSAKVDALESKLFDIRNVLKKANIY